MAAGAIAVALALITYQVGRGKAPAPVIPNMDNAGNAGALGSGPNPRAPDISSLSPRERFNRLFDRVISAMERQDTAQVVQFVPMALGAYEQLDSVDVDARYHAAMIHLAVGEVQPARALADTILRQAPGHLFGYMIRGEAAEQTNSASVLAESYADFLSHYDAETRTNRVEYREHQNILQDFKVRAEANRSPSR